MGFKTSICLCEAQVMDENCAELGSAGHCFADTNISSKAQGTPGEINPSLGDDSSAETLGANPSATEV